MKKYLLAILVALSFAMNSYAQTTQFERMDHYLSEYHQYKGKQPYAKAADLLYYASQSIYMVKKSIPYVFIRYAQLEYMDRYNVIFPEKNDEYWTLYYILERFQEDDGSPYTHVVQSTYSSHILYVKAVLRYIKFLKPEGIPQMLIECMSMLESCPEYAIEPEYTKYYDLLQHKIGKDDKEKMKKLVEAEASKVAGKYWADLGLEGLVHNKSRNYVNACLELAKSSDKAAATALEGVIGSLDGKTDEAINLYKQAANDNNVLATIFLVDFMSDTEKEIALLKNVENDEFFFKYGGGLELAERYARSDKISDIQKAADMCQANMGKNLFSSETRELKNLYEKCQARISLIHLQQQEEMLDPDDVLSSEYLALAQGYESIEGYEEKAMYYYRLAAEGGDLRSMCRVAIDDLYVGAVERDDEKVKNAANLILANQNSRFLPFMLNAAVVVLYGLNGEDPDLEKAKAIYERFVKMYERSTASKSYVEKDFLCGGDYIPSIPKLGFYDMDKAMRHFNEGVEAETAGNYESAAYSYTWSSTWGHPLGYVKADQMRECNSKNGSKH